MDVIVVTMTRCLVITNRAAGLGGARIWRPRICFLTANTTPLTGGVPLPALFTIARLLIIRRRRRVGFTVAPPATAFFMIICLPTPSGEAFPIAAPTRTRCPSEPETSWRSRNLWTTITSRSPRPAAGPGSRLRTGTDLDGARRANPPSMGCDEVWESALIDRCRNTARRLRIATRGDYLMTANVVGRISRLAWSFGDVRSRRTECW